MFLHATSNQLGSNQKRQSVLLFRTQPLIQSNQRLQSVFLCHTSRLIHLACRSIQCLSRVFRGRPQGTSLHHRRTTGTTYHRRKAQANHISVKAATVPSLRQGPEVTTNVKKMWLPSALMQLLVRQCNYRMLSCKCCHASAIMYTLLTKQNQFTGKSAVAWACL